MSLFKKTITSVVLLATLWHSAGNAMVATIKFSGQDKSLVAANNPFAAMPSFQTAASGMQNGLFDEPVVDIPLGSVPNGQVLDSDLMRQMYSEITEMAASAEVEMKDNPQLVIPDAQSMMTDGDSRVRSNDVGAIISNVNGNTQTTKVFDLTESTPMLWARYYPYRRTGYIQLVTIRKKSYTNELTTSRSVVNVLQRPISELSPAELSERATTLSQLVEVQTEILGPNAGERLAKSNGSNVSYAGVNPFKEFIGSTNPSDPSYNLYATLTFPAFMTAVGVWARHYSTQRGFVAVAENRMKRNDWSRCELRVLGACLRRSQHVEVYAELKPRWYIMSSADNAIGKSNVMAYKSPDCVGKPGINNPEIQCTVFSGVAFMEASIHSDIPQDWLKVWHQHYAKTGWTLLFFVLLLVITGSAFAAFVGPIFTGFEFAMYLAGGPMAGQIVLTTALVEGVLVGGAYALTSIILTGNGGLASIQHGLFGSLDSGIKAVGDEGDIVWSPNPCVVNGPAGRLKENATKGHGMYVYGGGGTDHRFQAPEKAPNTTQFPLPLDSGCIQWLTNDLEPAPGQPTNVSPAPGAVGEYYMTRRPNTTRDFNMPNDIKNIRDPDTRPLRNTGAPVRK